jgi:uncharacterized membrane protein
VNRDPSSAAGVFHSLAAFVGLILVTGLLAVGWQWVDSYPSGSRDSTGAVLWLSLAGSAALFIWFRPRDDPGQARSRRVHGALLAVRIWAAVAFIGGGLALVMLDYRLDDFYGTPDTAQYMRVAEAPITSEAFLAGERPFGLPLVLKAFGVTPSSRILYPASPEVRRFTQFQALVSLASFLLLGLSTALHLRGRLLKVLAVVGCVGLATVIDVGHWNRMLLSESLTNSLFVVVIATALFALRLSRRRDPLGATAKIGLLIALAAALFLFSNTRDTNAYLLLATGAAVIVGVLVWSVRTQRLARPYLLLAAWMLVVGMTQMALAARGERWLGPFSNVFLRRIVSDAEARAFFVAHGAPLAKSVVDEIGRIKCVADDCGAFSRDFLSATEAGADLLDWFRSDGRQVYASYLLAHAGRTLLAPIADVERLLDPDSVEYRQRLHPDPAWFPIVQPVFYPRPAALILIWAALLLPLLGSMMMVPSTRPSAATVLLLLALTYPHMFVVWHSDAVEIERHATLVALQVRLAVWMGTLLALDFLWDKMEARVRRLVA